MPESEVGFSAEARGRWYMPEAALSVVFVRSEAEGSVDDPKER